MVHREDPHPGTPDAARGSRGEPPGQELPAGVRELQGDAGHGAGRRVAIVVSRFHEDVTRRLLAGAVRTVLAAGVRAEDVMVVWTPGALEIPAFAHRLAAGGAHDAVVCLGAVIRGETSHFEYVAREASRGIAHAARKGKVAVTFGVLTTDTVGQALARAGGALGNKGSEAAAAALECADLLERLRD